MNARSLSAEEAAALVARTSPRPRRRRNEERRLAYAMMLPASAVVLVLIGYPFVRILDLSFREGRTMNFARLRTLPVGTANYSAIIADASFWHSVLVSAIYVGVTIGVSFAIGLATALLLNRHLPGRRLFRTIVLIPWAVPGVVASIIFLWMLDSSYGVVNAGLFALGFQGPAWFINPDTALVAVILPTIWKTYPLITLVVLAAMQSIPIDLYEAARLDGATPAGEFRYVTWPGVRAAATLAVMISALAVFRDVDIVFTTTRGGPSRMTETVALWVYNEGFEYFRMGTAAAAGLLMVATALLLFLVAIKVMRHETF